MDTTAAAVMIAALTMLLAPTISMAAAEPAMAEPKCYNNRINATIINNLGNGRHLRLHCKSIYNDWGEHMLADNAKFEMDQFKICSFEDDSKLNCTITDVQDGRTTTFPAYDLGPPFFGDWRWGDHVWKVSMDDILGYDPLNKSKITSHYWQDTY